MIYRFNPFTKKLDLDGGASGAPGVGVPVGGTAGQVLSKIDATNYNTQWVTGSGGGQAWVVDQIPVETPNGARTLFTTGTYIAGSIRVMLNGQVLTRVNDFTETSATTFTFVNAPLTGDVIRLDYRTS